MTERLRSWVRSVGDLRAEAVPEKHEKERCDDDCHGGHRHDQQDVRPHALFSVSRC